MVFAAVSRQKDKMLSLQSFKAAMGFKDEHFTIKAEKDSLVFPARLPTLKETSEMLIDEALQRSKGNQAIAAGLLGITPQALSKRLKRRPGATN